MSPSKMTIRLTCITLTLATAGSYANHISVAQSGGSVIDKKDNVASITEISQIENQWQNASFVPHYIIFRIKPLQHLFSEQQSRHEKIKNAWPDAFPIFKEAAQQNSGKLKNDTINMARYRLDRYYQINITGKTLLQRQTLLNNLRQDARIEWADFKYSPSLPLPRQPGDGLWDISDCDKIRCDDRQGYLNAWSNPLSGVAVGGINARYVWSLPGGDGKDITVAVVDGGKFHQNLNLPKPLFEIPEQGGDDHDHPYGVAGIVGATDIDIGIRGIISGGHLATVYPREDYQLLMDAANKLHPGDVITMSLAFRDFFWESEFPEKAGLCENSVVSGNDRAYICNYPGENDPVTQDMFRYFSLEKGLIVSAGAGNTGTNLEHSWFQGRFDPLRYDSGALIVGGINPRTGLRWKLNPDEGIPGQAGASSYGSRVNAFAWSWDVLTTYYNQNFDFFNGTSAATPIVSGALASAQGYWKTLSGGLPLPPLKLRNLAQKTGNFPLNGDEKIGTMPDLAKLTNIMNDIPLLTNGDFVIPGRKLKGNQSQTITFGNMGDWNTLGKCETEGNIDSFRCLSTGVELIHGVGLLGGGVKSEYAVALNNYSDGIPSYGPGVPGGIEQGLAVKAGENIIVNFSVGNNYRTWCGNSQRYPDEKYLGDQRMVAQIINKADGTILATTGEINLGVSTAQINRDWMSPNWKIIKMKATIPEDMKPGLISLQFISTSKEGDACSAMIGDVSAERI